MNESQKRPQNNTNIKPMVRALCAYHSTTRGRAVRGSIVAFGFFIQRYLITVVPPFKTTLVPRVDDGCNMPIQPYLQR